MRKSDLGKGLISYLLGWIGGLIVISAMKNNTKNDIMNAAQGIVISIANIVVSIASAFVSNYIPFFSLGVSILFLTITIIAIVNVINDKDPKLPVIGDIAESMFAGQLEKAADFTASNKNSGNQQANFDPNTGEPINKQQANFDPNTGEPINKQ